MADPGHLILPVESQVRELDAKLLLAGVAAERGFRVVLGNRSRISFVLPSLPRGLFFAKSMRFTSDRMTQNIIGLGHRMVASDEESLVRFEHPDYFSWRFSPQSFINLTQLFAWGPDDAAMFRASPHLGSVAVHETGNPRLDLLRPELRDTFTAEVDALRCEFGAFVLVNTNFSFVNNFVRSLNLIQPHGRGGARISRTGRGMTLPFALDMSRHQQALFDAFAALMPALAATFPERTFVLRPHPSENHDRWRQLVDGLNNVHVVHRGSVVPWLLACELLIHNGCTTAVEAAVLKTPSVSFRPVVSLPHDYALPNGVSVQVYDEHELLDAVADVLAGRSAGIGPATRSLLLDRHLAPLGGPLAAERIVSNLKNSGHGQPLRATPGRRTRAWLATHARTLVKRVNLRRRGHRNGMAYLRHRFEPLSEARLDGRLRQFGRILGRFDGVAARRFGEDVFVIERRPARSTGGTTGKTRNEDE